MPVLDVQNVTKLYRASSEEVAALRDVSCHVERGELVALTGRSGGGKTTLLNLCGAMDFPTTGQVLIDGESTGKLGERELTKFRRERVGFIFQSFQLIHTLTAAENVELPLLLARRSNARRTALDRLAWVDMPTYAERYPHQLSGGQQQRVAIARALAGDPKLVLADEPTGNLDTTTGALIIDLLRRVAGEMDVAVLMATHSFESAAVADRVLQLRDGRLEESRVHA